ncbi:hypothetical protein [Nocardia nova]|uniref:hypothetical protein n=1 Tax=Nocardia nova TaxID=37330 RepID=UPI0033E7916F
MTSEPSSGAPIPAGMCTDPAGCIPRQPDGSRSEHPEQRPDAPEAECGIKHISGCVVTAMGSFFSTVVSSALNPLLELLSSTLLTTPDPSSLPRVGALWNSSWTITITVYGLLIMVAGLLVMSYQTLQSRWSPREFAPGLILGMIAAALSFPLVTGAIRAANALSAAVAGTGVDPDSAGQALRQLVTSPEMIASLGLFGVLLALVLVVALVALLIGWVVRVAITITLIVAAPLALMCHALPITEPIARWWWRSMAACLAIQVIQSLALITATRVMLSPDGWQMTGANANSGLINLLISIALVGLLAKAPFWMLQSMRIGSGRSLVGGLVRSYIAYKTFGMLRGGAKGSTARRPRKPTSTRTGANVADDPYHHVETDKDGQMLILFPGLTPTPKPKPAAPAGRGVPASPRPADRRRQLTLDLTTPSPSLPPEADRPDGQYALFYATPATKPARRHRSPATTGDSAAPASTTVSTATPQAKRPAGSRQLALRFPPPPTPAPAAPARPADPYARPKSTTKGQYVLPLEVTRARRAPAPPAPAWIAPPAPRPPGRQLHLPLPDLPVRRRRRPDNTGGGAR